MKIQAILTSLIVFYYFKQKNTALIQSWILEAFCLLLFCVQYFGCESICSCVPHERVCVYVCVRERPLMTNFYGQRFCGTVDI